MSAVMHDGDLEQVNKRHAVFRVPYIDRNLTRELMEKNNVGQRRSPKCNIETERVSLGKGLDAETPPPVSGLESF